MTDATNKTAVSAAFPINADDTILFRLLSSIAISSVAEILPGHVVTMTLDASGDGLDDIPTPDTTGDDAWLWEVSLPDGREQNIAIGYDASTQDLAVLFAAVQSSTTPSDIAALITSKQDKVPTATEDNFAAWDAAGQTKDSGAKVGDLEPTLGNPGTDGFVLSSTIAGVRSWIAQAAGATWGSITGTLSDQTDLQDELDAKVSTADLSAAPVADEPLKADGSGGIAFGGKISIDAPSNSTNAISVVSPDSLGVLLSIENSDRRWAFGVDSGENFVIRDVTGGSLQPFVIQDGSPHNSFRIFNTGRIVVNGTSASSQLHINLPSAATIGQIIKLAAAQSANALEVQDSTGAALSSIDSDGNFVHRNYTDANRPAAGTSGRVIFNTDDGNLNIDNGTNWILPDGSTT